MNNKGQVLVIFVIIIPVILLLLTLVVDLGLISIEKRKIDNNTKSATEYYLNNIDDEDVKEKTKVLLNDNLDDIQIIINDNKNNVEITVTKTYKCVFGKILENEIKIKYIGNKSTKKIIKG